MIYQLSFLFIIFLIYSILGWTMESLFNFIISKKLTNRGFLMGPYCPIYGIGIILILFLLKRYQNDIIILFIMSIIICSLLEYLTSLIMELIFKNRWWDYSNMKFNINGRICLEYMIPFGIAGTFTFYIINPFINKLVIAIPKTILIISTLILFIIFLIDIIISANIISKFKNISKNVKVDSTDEITKRVKEIILNKGILLRRLINAFPKMKIKSKKKKI